MALLLQTYQDRHGLRTVRGIIVRWAPGDENDTAAYQQAVAHRLGVGLDQAVDLHDPATMRGMVEAIIRHELGGMPYGPETISEGLRMAGLVEPSIAQTSTVRAAAGTAAAGITAAAVLEAMAAIAPHAEGLSAILHALGPWTVALVVLLAAGWAIRQRALRQREVAP